MIRLLGGAMLLYTHLVWTLDLEAFFGSILVSCLQMSAASSPRRVRRYRLTSCSRLAVFDGSTSAALRGRCGESVRGGPPGSEDSRSSSAVSHSFGPVGTVRPPHVLDQREDCNYFTRTGAIAKGNMRNL